MTISLIPLPYADTALAPAISAATLQTHHDRHHRTYVDNVNAATKGGKLAKASLADIISATAATNDQKLFNNAAQVWNHGFYWHSLSPETEVPDANLKAAIDSTFGSLAALKDALLEQGLAHFGSGWVWLAVEEVEEVPVVAELPQSKRPRAASRWWTGRFLAPKSIWT